MIPVVFPNPATHNEGDVVNEDTRVNGSLGHSGILEIDDGLDEAELRVSRLETLNSYSGCPGS